MTEILLLILAVLVVATALVAVVRTVRADGYGRRPPPQSHLRWDHDVPLT